MQKIDKLRFIMHTFSGVSSLKFLWLLLLNRWDRIFSGNAYFYHDKNIYTLNFNFNQQQRKIKLRRQDIVIFFEVFYLKVYDVPLLKPENVKVILDVGSHIGFVSLYYSIIFPEANIYCVEPSSENIKLLRFNVQDISITPLAISNTNGFAFFDTSYNSYNSKLNTTGESIETITFKDLMSKINLSHIDLLKIDIEGAESLMFESIDDWKDKVRNLIMECHGNENEIISMLQTTDIHYKIV